MLYKIVLVHLNCLNNLVVKRKSQRCICNPKIISSSLINLFQQCIVLVAQKIHVKRLILTMTDFFVIMYTINSDIKIFFFICNNMIIV